MKHSNTTHRLKIAWLTCLLIMIGLSAHGAVAPADVSGRVIDKDGNPLPGVTITVKGMPNKGVTTDVEGYFKMSGLRSGRNVTLRFSYIGYESKEVKADFKHPMQVVLNEDVKTLDEVVITGYQVVDKRESASSVFSVKASDIMINNSMSVDNMLQGKVPGMAVMITSGEPGTTPKIRIRGNGTINGNKAPVWVVDGVIVESAVPFTASDLNSEDAQYLIGNSISGINPQDIETITVLKDASATAIYGVKAANGVIVITTKKGSTGRSMISYNGSVSFNQRPDYQNFDRMSAGERMQLSREIVAMGVRYPRVPTGDSYEGALQQLYRKELTQQEFADKIALMQTRNTDWYKEIFRNSINNQHNVSVSGGGRNSNYYFSLGYNNNLGATAASASERLTALGKINVQVNKRVDVMGKISYSTKNNTGYHPSVNPNMYAYKTSRTLAPYHADGSYAMYERDNGYQYNFLKEQALTGMRGQTNAFDGVFNLNVKLLPGLDYQGVFAYQHTQSTQRSWAEEESYAAALIRGYNYHQHEESSRKFQDSPMPFGGVLSETHMAQVGYTVRNTFNYKQTFVEKHSIHAMGGIEFRSNSYKGISHTGYGWTPMFGEKFMPTYTNSFIDRYVRQGLLNPTLTNSITRIASYFGTFSYSYDYKYTLNANIRSDGSNKFGSNPKYRWLPTWSVAGKWSIAEEGFMKSFKAIDRLDLRASYGIQGNIHDDSSPELIVRIDGRDGISQLDKWSIYHLPNPDLRWERTNTWDVALDFGLFGERVKGSFEIYRKNTSDLIHSKAVASSNGRKRLYINSGKMLNSGFEGFLNVDVIRSKKFDWSVGTNFANNYNRITRANNDIFSDIEKVNLMLRGEMVIEGEPIGSLYSYHFAGLSPENGYPLFYAKDGRKVHMGDPQMMELVNCASIFPTLYGGFDTQFTYNKSLSLSFGFTYNIGGMKRLPNAYEDMNSVFDPLQNVSRDIMNRWKKPGDEQHTTIPTLYNRDEVSKFVHDDRMIAMRKGSTDFLYPTQLYNYSDERVIKANYLRLHSVALSYALPAGLLRQVHLKTCMLRLQATNLHVWANKRWRGLDPETPNANIPILPAYTLTVNFSL